MSQQHMLGKNFQLAIMWIILTALCLCSFPPFSFSSDAVKSDEHSNTLPVQQKSGQIKTIIVDNYYPYTFVNDQGNPDGFSVDLMQAVAKVMGLEISITADTWEHAVNALKTGGIDFLPMMAYSAERAQMFDFSAPHTIAYDAFFTRNNSEKIRTVEDLRGKTIIVMKNDQAHNYLRSTGFITPEQMILIDSLPDALRFLASGKGETALMPKLVGMIHIRNLHLTNLEPSPMLVEAYKRPFSFAVRKGNLELLERLSQGLNIVKTTGEYNIVYAKWFGAVDPPKMSFKAVLKYLWWFFTVILLIGIIVLLWLFFLKRQIALRTKELKQEIRERKEVEDSLRKSEEQFRTAFDNAAIGMALTGIDGRLIKINRAFYDMLGYTEDELTSLNFAEVTHPDDIGKGINAIQSLISGEKKVCNFEKRYITKSGQIIWTEITTILLRDSDGTPLHLITHILNITERKEAEKALKQSEDRYRSLVENQTELISRFSPDGTFTIVNEAYCRFFNKTKEELVGKKWQSLPVPEDVALIKEKLLSLSPSNPTVVIENRLYSGKGDIRWMQFINMGFFDSEGNLLEIQSVGRDINERKQAEEEIRRLNEALENRVQIRTAELEASNKELESFCYSVSHDLRSPLRAIDGWSLAILEDYADKFDDQGRKYLHHVRSESQRMAQLIDDLLNLSVLTRREMRIVRVCLSELAQNIADTLKKSNYDRMAQFIIQPDLTAEADAGMIEIVLFNLIGNAWKFTGKTPKAKIEFGKVRPEDSQPKDADKQIFFVRDNGVGFEMTYAKKLFGAFQRLHKVSEFPGTGIGLAIVQRIIHRHGGRVWAEGAVNRGAAFYFTI